MGCGAVGSEVARLAAKMGFTKFVLWDDDHVEPHNLPNQAYDLEHIGMLKVEALKQVLQRFNPRVECHAIPERFGPDSKALLDGPFVVAPDSMESRKIAYNAVHLNPNANFVYEIRLGFDYGELHIVDNMNPEYMRDWRATFGNDNEIPEGPCSLKICGTLVNLIGSYLVHSLCAHYSARSKLLPWKYHPHTAFVMDPLLEVHQTKGTREA